MPIFSHPIGISPCLKSGNGSTDGGHGSKRDPMDDEVGAGHCLRTPERGVVIWVPGQPRPTDPRTRRKVFLMEKWYCIKWVRNWTILGTQSFSCPLTPLTHPPPTPTHPRGGVLAAEQWPERGHSGGLRSC